MKKTIVVNLGGAPFQIEDDAYEKLKSYLEQISANLGNNAEAKEVVADIESRIAELLRLENIDNMVITSERVSQVIEIMGNPEQFVGDGADGEPAQKEATNINKRLYRHRYHKIIGGVCGGLATYFNVDVALVRILFILLFFLPMGKYLAILYIIMWIAVPKASLMEHMMMLKQQRGGMRNDYVRYSTPNYEGYKPRQNGVVTVIVAVLGFLVFFTGVMGSLAIGIGTATVLGSISANVYGVAVSEWVKVLAPEGVGVMFWPAIITILLLPFLFLMYAGIRMMVKFKSYMVLVFGITIILFILAASVVAFDAVRVGYGFNEKSTKSIELNLEQPSVNKLVISRKVRGDNYYTLNGDFDGSYKLMIDSVAKSLRIANMPEIKVEHGDSLSCTITSCSRGRDITEAVKYRQLIRFSVVQKDTILYIDDLVYIDKNIPFRMQNVKMKLVVPHGVEVEVEPEIRHLVDF